MSFKSFLTSIAATGVTLGSLGLASVPAHALSFGDQLNLVGESRFQVSGSTALLNFDDNPIIGSVNYSTPTGKALVGASSAAVFGPGTVATLKDLSLTKSGSDWIFNGLLPEFLTFSSTSIKYSLTSFILKQTKGGRIPAWEATYDGFFTNGSNLDGIGVFTTQGQFKSVAGTTYSTTAVAVPTPALLPGLIGLGVAALRRKNEESTEESA